MIMVTENLERCIMAELILGKEVTGFLEYMGGRIMMAPLDIVDIALMGFIRSLMTVSDFTPEQAHRLRNPKDLYRFYAAYCMAKDGVPGFELVYGKSPTGGFAETEEDLKHLEVVYAAKKPVITGVRTPDGERLDIGA